MSSGISRYFCGLVFVYCLYRVTGLSHPHFYEVVEISTSQSHDNIPVGDGLTHISILQIVCYSFTILGKTNVTLSFTVPFGRYSALMTYVPWEAFLLIKK